MRITLQTAAVAAAAMGVLAVWPAQSQAPSMSFFVTSAGPGDGGNLGGLAGADEHCNFLAAAVGQGDKTWRAYLSSQGADAVNARDRIGAGPWHNAMGVEIAANVDALHADDGNNINKETALNEMGDVVNGRGDSPNRHDILTGTQQDGVAFAEGDMTCSNWTSNGDGGAMVGHHDLTGNPSGVNFWNFSHPSRGCSQDALVGTGGDGLFYCFATDEM
jgi:hypothetical protein